MIKVNLVQNSYEIHIGFGKLNQIGEHLVSLGYKDKAIIITNPTVDNLYSKTVRLSLEASGIEVFILKVPDGEEYKTLEQAGKLFNQLIDIQAERITPILALGGGVIGDLAGFVAATYMRGLPLVQLPTTLLAQVDSSIGGKVAVNYGKMKNNIGTFYQPKLVMADTSTLQTLPDNELDNGLAEVIKYGIIWDKEFFQMIDDNMERLKLLNQQILEEAVVCCAGIKAGIVEKDEKDQGLRNILNYGHTIGHAIETVSDFKVKHGQGVAIGMVAAAMISHRMGVLARSELERIISIITKAGLPVGTPRLPVEKILQAMQHDKKRVGGNTKFILPNKIGEVFVNGEVSNTMVTEVLKDLQ